MRAALAAALFVLAACGEGERESSPLPGTAALRPIAPGGPPSVPVLQARPGQISEYGWITDTLVYVVDGAWLHVWDPATGRVLLVERFTPGLAEGPVIGRRGDRVVFGGTVGFGEIRLDRGEVVSLPGNLPSSDPETYLEIARDVDVPLEERELIVHRAGGLAPARIRARREARIAFSRDASTLMFCEDDGVRFHDVTSGAERAAITLDHLTECAWPEGAGPVVVLADGGLHLIDPMTLVAAPPIPHVAHAHVSADGRRLALATTSSREGLTVIDLATRRELLHVSAGSPDRIRIVGDLVAAADVVERGPGHGVVRRIAAVPEGIEVVAAEGLRVEHLGPLGALVVEDGIVMLRNTIGEVVARFDHPELATLRLDDRALHAHLAGADAWFDERGAHAFGPCPEERTQYGVVPPRAMRIAPRRYLVSARCVAVDDGAHTGEGAPLTATEDGRVSLWVDGGRLVVHLREGDQRRPLVLDEGETQPCQDARCALPVALSPDGARLAVVRDPLLRVFDTSNGVPTHRANVSDRTRTLGFLASGALVQDDSAEGAFRILSASGRGRLQERAHVPHRDSRGYTGDSIVHGDWALYLDAEGTLHTFDASGRELAAVGVARMARVMPSGDFVAATVGGSVPVLRLPGLTEIGRPLGDLLAAIGPDVFLCRGGQLVRAHVEEARINEVLSDAPCPASIAPFGSAWLGDQGQGSVVLVRHDGRAIAIQALRHGDRFTLVGRDGDRGIGAARWMLRSPGLTADGMLETAPALASIEAWLAEVPQ